MEQRPTALLPGQAARYHLLRLQAEALETEGAALKVAILTSAIAATQARHDALPA